MAIRPVGAPGAVRKAVAGDQAPSRVAGNRRCRRRRVSELLARTHTL